MKLIYDDGDLQVSLIEKKKRCFNVVKITKEAEDKYKMISADININSKNIDRGEIETYAGMDEIFDPEEFAVACLEYYGNKFWGGSVGYFSKEEVEEFLKNNITEEENEEEI